MMTRHPHIDQLRAHIAGEISATENARVAEHLAGCSDCRTELQWIDNVLQTIPSLPVHRSPNDMWNRIAARAQKGNVTPLLPSFSLQKKAAAQTQTRAFLRAAVLILIAAGAASATLPNSPVRTWLERVWKGSKPAVEQPNPSPGTNPNVVPAERSDAVFVLPASGGQPLTIAVESPDPRLRIRLIMIDGTEVLVRATSDAALAQFHSAPGRLGIVGGSAGEVVLSIPRRAERIQMQVDGRVYLEKRGSRINILAPTADTVGAEIVIPVR